MKISVYKNAKQSDLTLFVPAASPLPPEADNDDWSLSGVREESGLQAQQLADIKKKGYSLMKTTLTITESGTSYTHRPK